MDSEAYDQTARTLTASLQAASTPATWKTATIDELLQGGGLDGLEEYYVVEARVATREFLLRKRISRTVVEQDIGEAVELLVDILNARLAPGTPQ
jgi:hypothetical protein